MDLISLYAIVGIFALVLVVAVFEQSPTGLFASILGLFILGAQIEEKRLEGKDNHNTPAITVECDSTKPFS